MPSKPIAYIAATLIASSLIAMLYTSGLGEEQVPSLAVLGLIACGGLVFLALDCFGVLCMVLAFLPFTEGAFKFEFGIITFSPFTMGIIVLGLAALFLVLLGRVRYRLERFDLVLAALCVFYMCSLLTSSNMVDGGYLAFHALFIPTLTYFVLRVFLSTPERLDLAFAFFAWGIGVFCLASLGHSLSTMERVSFLRVPPVSAATLAVAPLLFVLYSGRGLNRSGLLLALTSLLTMVLSFSRMYFLLFALSPLIMAPIRRGKALKAFLYMLPVTLWLTVALAMSVPEEYVDSYWQYTRTVGIDKRYREDESGAGRVLNPSHWKKTLEVRALLYRIGLENFLEHPLVGTGLYQGKRTVTQHNFHVEWLEFGGIVGYLLTVLAFAAYLGRMAAAAKKDSFLACCVLVVLVILGNALTNGFLHGFFPYIAFLAIGFSYARLSLKEQDNLARENPI